MIARVSWPGSLTAALGERVAADRAIAPSTTFFIDGYSSASTPITLIPGFIALAAVDDPGDQTAAADRNDQRIEIGRIFQHFQRDCSRPGHDCDVVERMDEDIAFFASSSRAWV